ncbi:MAG: hypothetical protein AAF456_17000 [Planctomycetota bacterium]
MFTTRRQRRTNRRNRQRPNSKPKARRRKGGSILSALILECLAIGGILFLFFTVHEDPRTQAEPASNGPQLVQEQNPAESRFSVTDRWNGNTTNADSLTSPSLNPGHQLNWRVTALQTPSTGN